MKGSEDDRIHAESQFTKAADTLSTLAPVKAPTLDGKPVLSIDKMRLLYFPANQSESKKTPLIICYALVNRPTILDIEPDRSFIKGLCDRGYDIYLIDWGYPDLCDRHLSLDDYIADYLDCVIKEVCKRTKESQVNLLGICQGGVFSLAYASLHPERIKRLITLVTPVDTSVPGFTLSEMIRETDVAQLVNAYGNLPGSLLNQIYASLKPLQLGVIKEFTLAGNLLSDTKARSYLLMEQWINDSPDLSGQAALEFAELFFQGNGLVNGHLMIEGKPIVLSHINAPILNIFGLKDHLVPAASSKALKKALHKKTRYTELALDAGHIGVFISPRSQRKVIDAIELHLS